MEGHLESARVQESGLQVLLALSGDDATNAWVTVACVNATLAAMREHAALLGIQEKGSGVLSFLGDREEERSAIVAGGGVELLVAAVGLASECVDSVRRIVVFLFC